MNVNTVTNETSVVRQGIGNYGPPPGWPYGEIFVESITSNDNYVAPCELTLSVRLKFTVAAGSFGDAMIKLRKVN